ncbi:zinc finger protein 814-like [Paramacrobiotus metropolitanus]|uniref:zinc finger protein 814-like n=1 Tax=Paramacrobiotus metropolitanus TaxID=2943436 RepID=UPI0024462BC0|nr:zinc finger protein 814-like [Paramacrobiotus metropolitanus]
MPAPQRCQPLEQIFCGQCQKWTDLPCLSHAQRVRDASVLPYSVASLPHILYLDVPQHGQADKAVFAKEAVLPLTVFGPLIGVRSKKEPADVAFACGNATRKGLHYFHLESDETTNWMKYVRFAQSPEEQNLAAYEVHEASPLLPAPAVSPTRTHVIFVSTKTIQPGDELKVAYSLVYSQAYGGPDAPKAQPTRKNHAAASQTVEHDNPNASSTGKGLVRPEINPSVEPNAPTDTIIPPRPVTTVKRLRFTYKRNTPRPKPVPNGASVKDKENDTGQVAIEARPKKRRKLTDDSMEMPSFLLPNFLPPDEEDPVVNMPANAEVSAYGIAAVAVPDVAVEPEVAVGVGDFYDAGNDSLGGETSTSEPRVTVPQDDNGESTQPTEPVEQKRVADVSEVLIKQMDSLKSKAHLKLRNSGVCLVCGKHMKNLPEHLENMHTDADVQAVDDACFICHRKFKNRSSLTHHFNIVHRVVTTVPDEASQAAALEFMRRTGFLNYCCSKCRQTFPSKKLLDLHSFKHNKDHTDQHQRRCSECPFEAAKFADLVKHTSKHALSRKLQRFPCLLCGAEIGNSIREHMEIHHPEAFKLIKEAWKFQCPECRQTFPGNTNLNNHVSIQHKGWQCVYCGQRGARGWLVFDQHVRTHKIEKSFPCLVCDKSFKKYHRLCIHLRDSHQTESVQHPDMVAVADTAASALPPVMVERAIEHMRDTQQFSCYCWKCKQSFASFELLDLHAFRYLDSEDPQDDPRRECPACPFHAASFAELVQHTSQHRLRKLDRRPCLICGTSVKHVRAHIQQHHPDVMQRITETFEHPCPECGDRFRSRGALEFHTKVKHKGYQCWYCAKVFRASNLLGSHVVEHSVNGEYPCPACDKILPNYPQINVHYQACHDATRLKTCSVCQATFFGEDKLDQHMAASHSNADEREVSKTARCGRPLGAKPTRACDFCGKSFKSYQAMYYHRLTVHLGKKPKYALKVRVQCDRCGKMFSCKETLHNHVQWVHMDGGKKKLAYQKVRAERIAAGLPADPMCNYVRPRNRTAFEDFKYKCEECQLGYTWQISLTKHNESRHPEKILQQPK